MSIDHDVILTQVAHHLATARDEAGNPVPLSDDHIKGFVTLGLRVKAEHEKQTTVQATRKAASTGLHSAPGGAPRAVPHPLPQPQHQAAPPPVSVPPQTQQYFPPPPQNVSIAMPGGGMPGPGVTISMPGGPVGAAPGSNVSFSGGVQAAPVRAPGAPPAISVSHFQAVRDSLNDGQSAVLVAMVQSGGVAPSADFDPDILEELFQAELLTYEDEHNGEWLHVKLTQLGREAAFAVRDGARARAKG